MQILTVSDIIKATNGRLIAGDEKALETEISNITTNSREADKTSLFIPLVGETVDGHRFIGSAFGQGAVVSLTHNDEAVCGGVLIKVDDTRKALGDIARYYKKKYPLKSVSVTGSVGKTTTKDMIYGVISQHYKSHKTPNNFNNDIGLPLTIFGLENEHEAAVLEMGMNHFGEIEYLAGIGCTDVAVITNIGMSHIENLGSQEGIFKAKMEIVTGFDENNTLIVNGDDKFLKTVTSDTYKVIKYGLDVSNDVYAKDIVSLGLSGIKFTIVYFGEEFEAFVSQPGVHNVYNALAAVCVGKLFGVTTDECIKGLKECEYTSSRLEIINANGIEIINDCYNSSPDSVRAALKVQQNTLCKHRVAILGDILEMGEYAKEEHYKLGRTVYESGVDFLICVGENAKEIAKGASECGMENIKVYDTTDSLAEVIGEFLREGDSVLVKASHGMQFFKITDAIKNINSEKEV